MGFLIDFMDGIIIPVVGSDTQWMKGASRCHVKPLSRTIISQIPSLIGSLFPV
jgi:hypothetical protein